MGWLSTSSVLLVSVSHFGLPFSNRVHTNIDIVLGKTFSAEATSEHVRRPLYVIGGGDLGTTAASLDDALEKIFDVATAWKAIVLIDEADVFLEQRSLHDLERNAMVAVL